MTKVEVTIRGLCAFVRPQAAADPLVLVLVNGPASHDGHEGHGSHAGANAASAVHSGFLTAWLQDLDKNGSDDPTIIVSAPGGHELGLWDLKGSQVVVTGVGPQAPLPAQTLVVDMAKVVQGGRIHPSCLNGTMAHMSGRALLSGGALAYHVPAANPFPDPWTFMPVVPGYTPQLVDQAKYTVDMAAGATVAIQKLNGSADRKVTLANRPQIGLSISNLAAVRTNPSTGVQHFGVFYDLLATPANSRPIPTYANPVEGAWGSFCPEAMFPRQ